MIELNKIKKILIIRLSSLGDILLTTPLVAEIKKRNPEIIIDFLLKPAFADVYKYNPYIHSLIIYDLLNPNATRKVIKKNNYDLIIDLQNNLRTKLLLAFVSAAKVKFKKPFIKKMILVNFKINLFKEINPVPALYAKTVNYILPNQQGLELYDKSGKIHANGERQNIIGFCPGAKHYTKMWAEENFIQLGNMLAEKGFEIYLFGGSMEINKCKMLSTRIKNAKDFSNENNLLLTAEKMKNCKLIVSNDSALMHLGSALKIPIVAIFGSSVKEFGFSPFNVIHEIVEVKNLKCRPCSHIGRNHCPRGHFNCMNAITSEKVFEKINSLIN